MPAAAAIPVLLAGVIAPAAWLLRRHGRPVSRGGRALAAALALLARNAGKVLTRDQILQELRGIDCDAFNRSVDITMSRLRQKLDDDPKNPEFIKTVWGAGYVFIGQSGG